MNNSTSKKWGGVTLTTIMFSAMSVFSQTQPNALPVNGRIGIGTATPACELDVNGATSIDGTLIVKDSVRLEKKLIVDQDTRIKGKTIIDGNLRAKSNLKVIGNSRVEGNSKVMGNSVTDGNAKIFGVTKMKGNAFVEGDFKFKQLADASATADKWLTIDENGKVKSLDKAGLLNLIYSDAQILPCLNIATGFIPAPIWQSSTGTSGVGGTPGVLYTNQDCPTQVGIRTSSPTATLDVRGSSYFSGNMGIGKNSSFSSKLYIKQTNPTKNALTVELTSNSSNTNGVGIKMIVNNSERIALSVVDNASSNDVFRVYGNGVVYATEVNVRLKENFPDYVFSIDYNLRSIEELEKYIKVNQHLPNIPSANIIEEKGIDLGEMNRVLVEKVEELTLYIIDLQKQINDLK